MGKTYRDQSQQPRPDASQSDASGAQGWLGWAQGALGNAALGASLPQDGDGGCGYEVQEGDSLWGISERLLGGGARWPDLYAHNQEAVGEDPNLIFPGQNLDVCLDTPAPTTEGTTEQDADVIDMTEGGFSTEITEPTTIRSALGEVSVYPDDFIGPLPQGAVRASDHEQMLAIYERIDAGQSQVGFDLSNFTEGIDPATQPEEYQAALEEGAAFKAQMMGYLGELIRTPLGLEFLSDLDSAEHTVTIQSGDEGNSAVWEDGHQHEAQNGTGANSIVTVNPSLLTYQGAGDAAEPWMTDRPQFGFYHELSHAWHEVHGTLASGQSTGVNAAGRERQISNWEWQTMGFGDYADERYTDNTFRAALGKEYRPNYGGYTPQED